MKTLVLSIALCLPACAQFNFFNALSTWKGEDITTGLLAHYPLDEPSGDAVDTSGNGRTMAQIGTVPASNPGRGPFTAGTNYFAITNSTLNLNSTSWTISGWFNLNSTVSGQPLIFHNSSLLTWSIDAFDATYSGTRAGATVFYGLSSAISVSAPGSTITTNSLHFICATFDAGTLLLTCSIDNGSVGSGTSGSPNIASGPVQIGYSRSGSNLVGKAYHIRIYNRVLTSAQITYLYNGGTPN